MRSGQQGICSESRRAALRGNVTARHETPAASAMISTSSVCRTRFIPTRLATLIAVSRSAERVPPGTANTAQRSEMVGDHPPLALHLSGDRFVRETGLRQSCIFHTVAKKAEASR